MKITFLIIVVLLALTLIVFFVRSRIAPNHSVIARDIPEVVSQLQKSGNNGNFAVFIFVPPGSKDSEAINLQYSIEGGNVGLDWVLIGAPNIADRERVKVFASGLGYGLVEKEMNGVRYLRVTGPGISELGTKIIQDFYHIPAEKAFSMVTEGFTWQLKQ